MEMRGQGVPSGRTAGSCGVSTVHGQPVLPAGGGGRSASVGQRMTPLRLNSLAAIRRPLSRCDASMSLLIKALVARRLALEAIVLQSNAPTLFRKSLAQRSIG